MSNLNEIYGLNTYCGPGVLSALSGKSTDTCARVISNITGKQVIKAVQLPDLVEACRRLDLKVEAKDLVANSLFGTINSLVREPGNYIIGVPKHVIVIEIIDSNRVNFIDNHTKTAIPASQSARLHQKVDAIYKVSHKTADEKKRERYYELKQKLDAAERNVAYYQIIVQGIKKQMLELDEK